MTQYGKTLVFALSALLVLALSQLSSYLIDAHLAIGETQVLAPFLYFTHVRNMGGTFGVLQGHSYLFAALSTVLIGICSVAFVRSKPTHWLQALLFGFIIGGGTANVVDRLVRGSVVDFINVQGIPHWQYIFNTADVFIHLGIWPTLLISFLQARKENAGNAH
ncbi:MAG TPA: signal peptidase II [Burkholderiaceae bacterium]